MNNEYQAAQRTLDDLNAPSSEAASDSEVFRLGQLLKDSASVDLPAPDGLLRDQLIDTLKGPAAQTVALAKEPKPSAQDLNGHRSPRKWILALTAAVATIVVGLAWFEWRPMADSLRFASSKSVNPASDEESTNSIGKLSQVEPGVQNARVEFESQLPESPDLDSESVSNDLAFEAASEPTDGIAVQLPETNEMNSNSVVSVPDGGTVLMGGVKRTSKGKLVAGNGFVQSNGSIVNDVPIQVLPGLASNSSSTSGVKLMVTPKVVVQPGHADQYGITNFAVSEEWSEKLARRSFYKSIKKLDESKNAEQQMLYRQLGDGEMGRFSFYLGVERSGGQIQAGEQYEAVPENQFMAPLAKQARSTFSIDVDTASYSNMRRFINQGQRPPANSVRIEEFINYFRYNYPQPKGDQPFAVSMEVAECPWNQEHRLVRIGIKGKEVHRAERPPSNLVFLLDVSGSMSDANKLPLLQRALQLMLDRLSENDRVSIVTYAGDAGVRLEPTSGDQKRKIRDVIEGLSSGGSTNGSAGIERAYELAAANFIAEGTNRVILATDGDLNVGVTSDDQLVKLIKKKSSEGVFLTVLGFGTGNLKDAKLEKLADNGNGNYAYIDSIGEANKVLVQQMSGSLVTIAKDVKLQVEFNPAEVKGYRLVGYENRRMANEDFANDKKDAGEIGAGHTVTAFYEIIPANAVDVVAKTVEVGLKYQQPQQPEPETVKADLSPAAQTGEMLTLAIRYKQPDQNESQKSEFVLSDSGKRFYEASSDFRFAAAVASYGMVLRNSRFLGDMNLDRIQQIASEALGDDASGYRAEFLDLVRQLGSR